MDVAFLTPLNTRSPLLYTLAVSVLPLFAVYTLWTRLIRPLFYSPLRHIPPAHPSAPFSSLWVNYIRLNFRENRTLLEAHGRLGDVIRLGPNEISINCVDNGLRAVYAGGFDKPEWYPNLFTNYDGVQIMFATMESGPHSARKRMMSNVYAKSYLQSSSTMALVARNVIYGRLLPLLQVKERMGAVVNIRRILESATMDIVTGYMLGFENGAKFLKNQDEAEWWLTRYQSRKAHTFWPQEKPRLTNFLSKLGIHMSPMWVAAANQDLEAWCLRHCEDAENSIEQSEKIQNSDSQNQGDQPVVYAQLRSQLQRESQKPNAVPLSTAPHRLQIASEMLDHLSAGHETSAITLTFLFYELSLRPSLQRRLRAELRTLDPPVTLSTSSSTPPNLPSGKDLDTLPLLHAILMETLRGHPAIPGPQPRITPLAKRPGDSQVGAFTGIPSGVRVSANAYCLHHNADVFPEPEAWTPERWLDPHVHPSLAEDISKHRPAGHKPHKDPKVEAESLREMHRWFWAFGSGGRMCIGNNLAMLQMKVILASIVSCFHLELVALDDEKVCEGAYEGVWDDDPDGRELREPLEAPFLEQQDTYTAQPLAKRVDVRLKRWEEPRRDDSTDSEVDDW